MAEEMTFEEALSKLEEMVKTLEDGGLTLEQATALFEEGVRLANICHQRLESAELKITQLQSAFFSEAIENFGDEL
ncbi:MAG: exodeoxyribonuclease VII small subunit [Chloroflexi bacterium]|nr:exodeoxyribonuclease VII small subunit [Chloroflexota bacterium]